MRLLDCSTGIESIPHIIWSLCCYGELGIPKDELHVTIYNYRGYIGMLALWRHYHNSIVTSLWWEVCVLDDLKKVLHWEIPLWITTPWEASIYIVLMQQCHKRLVKGSHRNVTAELPAPGKWQIRRYAKDVNIITQMAKTVLCKRRSVAQNGIKWVMGVAGCILLWFYLECILDINRTHILLSSFYI